MSGSKGIMCVLPEIFRGSGSFFGSPSGASLATHV